MKFGETVEKSSATEQPENLEVDFEIDDEQKFEQHRDKILSDIESRASLTKEDGIARLDRISHSYGLSEQGVTCVREESQLDTKLKSNSDEIDRLNQNTNKQIRQIGKAPESEKTPETKEKNNENRDFSKRYASMNRDVLARQLKRMRIELSQVRTTKIETFKNEILEIKQNLQKLENEYHLLKHKLDQEKNKFLNRLFKHREIFQIERHLEERKVTLKEIKKDIEERYRLFDEVSGLSEAERDRNQIRKKLDEFYNNQEELRQKFESEQANRSVAEISKKEKVFFIHGMSLLGRPQQGSEYNNAFIDSNKSASKTKLELIIGLNPTLSCSTIKDGDDAGRIAGGDKVGIILGHGRVLYGKESDAYTVTENSPFIRRSKDDTKEFNPLQSDIQQNPEKNIKRVIAHKDEFGRDWGGYNEFVVENPEVAGLFFDYKTYHDYDEQYRTAQIKELQKLAKELQIPLYSLKDGKVQIFERLASSGEMETSKEIDFSDLKERMPQFSPEDKKRYVENVVAENPFRMNTKAQRMYSAYIDGERAYQILIGKDPKIASSAKNFRTNYALIDMKFDEVENKFTFSVNSVETYLQNISNMVDKREKDANEATGKLSEAGLRYSFIRVAMESQKDANEDVESVYAQVYAISEAARSNGDMQTVEKIEAWLVNHKALERMQKFVANRINENGQLKFILEEDVPKEVRERLSGDVNINTMRKAA